MNKNEEIFRNEIVCSPISTLEEAWTCLKNPPKWISKIVELVPRSNAVLKCSDINCHVEEDKFTPIIHMDGSYVPRTIVCHDMKGGYIEDRFTSPLHKGNGYTFFRWAQIDTFIYFSHNLITIPPLNWINVSHRNGVRILGTFITEWNSGAIICNEILRSSENIQKFANIMADICVIYKIDGWLINIENTVENTKKLVEFVEYLTKLTHIRRPGSMVIWYDSVTVDGKLIWQNELNNLNRCYFDVCDGIFLNYTWKEINLENSVRAAKHRNMDVYVGVDVFGRNCFGGGNFNTHLALEKVRKYNLSVSIFAQGWTHETLEKDPELTFMDRFLKRDNTFWRTLWPYLYTHLYTLPFNTSFYCGSDRENYKLNSQEIQLSQFLWSDNNDNVDSLSYNNCKCLQMVFDGKNSSCLLYRRHLDDQKSIVHRLLFSDILINNSSVIIYVYTNPPENANDEIFSLILLLQNANSSFKQIICHSYEKKTLLSNATLTELNVCTSSEVYDKITEMNAHYPEKWKLRCFECFIDNFKIVEVGATILQKDSICLCGLGIMIIS